MDDIEGWEDILRLLNNPNVDYLEENEGKRFTEREVRSSLRRLLDAGLVDALGYDERTKQLQDVHLLDRPLESCWFRLTASGRERALKPFPWKHN